MATIPSKMDLRCQLELIAAESDDAAQKFRLVAYTGKPMRVGGHWLPVIIDLAGAKFHKKNTPVLMDHAAEKRIGHTVDQVVDASKITAVGIVSSSSSDAQVFVADSTAGFPFEASVGADILSAYEVEKGDKVTINGKEWKGPLLVADKTSIREISIVVLGADSGTSTKLAASVSGPLLQVRKGGDMSYEEFVTTMGFELADVTAEQEAAIKAHLAKLQQPGKEPEEEPEEVDAISARRQRAAQDDLRIDAIRDLAEKYRGVKAITLGGKPRTLGAVKATAIKKGWSANKFELVCLRASRTQAQKTGGVHTVKNDIQAKALEVAVLRAMAPGLPESAKHRSGRKYGMLHWYGEEALEAADGRQYDGMGLHYLMDLNIRAAGRHYSGSRKSDAFVREFLYANRDIQASGGGASTLAVSSILESAANKVLLASYESQQTIWDQVCGVKSLSDFKPHNFYSLTVHGAYAKVGASGELKHGEFADDKRTVEGDTYGMILGLTRKDMINDDLNAFGAIPANLGRLAALAIEYAVLDLILTNTGNFFSQGNKNVIGVGSALGIEGLKLAAKAFRDQVDAHGRPILIAPDRILVSSANEVLAGELFKEAAATWTTVAGEKATKRTPGNPHVGKYRPIVSPILNNEDIRKLDGSSFVNQDDDQWYMFTDPSVLPAFLIGFLSGRQTPIIESSESDFAHLGMRWRSYHDWGVAQGDPKGAIMATGEEESND